MKIEELEKELKQKKLRSIYLLYGEEKFLLESTVKSIKKIFGEKITGINYIMLDEGNVNEIISDIETPAFGYEKKLIIVKNAGLLKKDTKKQLEQYLKYSKKPKKEINFFMQIRKANDLLVRDYKYLQAIEPEWTEKGILRSIKRNDHIKIIMLDDNPIADEESLIKINTILKFNGNIYPKLKMNE